MDISLSYSKNSPFHLLICWETTIREQPIHTKLSRLTDCLRITLKVCKTMSWETSGQRVLCYVVVVAFSSSSFTETCSLVSSQWSSVALFTSAFHYFARWVRWSRIGAKDFCTNYIPWEGGGVSWAENKLNYSILVLFQFSLVLFWSHVWFCLVLFHFSLILFCFCFSILVWFHFRLTSFYPIHLKLISF